MASIAANKRTHLPLIAADGFEKLLATAAVLLLAAVIIAIARGHDRWALVPPMVWAHLATIGIALALTPVMLLRRRGDRRHRALGRVWAVAMFMTALLSFSIRGINRGGLSFIHLLSAWTLIQVPIIVWSARRHDVARHRSAVRGMVFGALLVAGFFTFPFNRLLGRWLFG
ncbi:hypothetical protein ABDK56_02185 [Sphingomonas sp. ASV193]|uniref:DUF2306 domain-containing protein n=1 Tax=Sphingomonas sp. ASV193 TaxID=3144405 RepID=UPI0032E86290